MLPQQPKTAVGATIGCIQHLQYGTTKPVRRLLKVLNVMLAG